METHADLGAFLRSRRALLRPEDAGLPAYGSSRRRVPGLRREELAQLAGVSAGYYTRLEQGQSPNASDSVLDAVARVLRLDDDERAHLYSLARPRPKAPRREAEPERVRPGVRNMIRSFADVPALVLGRFGDILDWNRAAHALLAGHLDIGSPDRPGDRPNIARLVFLDPHTRELYGASDGGWARKARATVADLRLIAGRFPDDPGLTGLVGERTSSHGGVRRAVGRALGGRLRHGYPYVPPPEGRDDDADGRVHGAAERRGSAGGGVRGRAGVRVRGRAPAAPGYLRTRRLEPLARDLGVALGLGAVARRIGGAPSMFGRQSWRRQTCVGVHG
ncbi:helix-turn-helix domain-containing protein [Streptomyces niveus]|uniref:helix-turn-helix domain-containing protein n=1 Tax=Streptomyces niveus TaxID=193462 RepID=UPI003F4DC584